MQLSRRAGTGEAFEPGFRGVYKLDVLGGFVPPFARQRQLFGRLVEGFLHASGMGEGIAGMPGGEPQRDLPYHPVEAFE